MKRKEKNSTIDSKAMAIATIILATVACGAANQKEGRSAQSSPQLDPKTLGPQISLAPLIEKVAPAVVNIRTTSKPKRRAGRFGHGNLFEWFFGPRDRDWPPFFRPPEREYDRRSLGSGFVIDDKGPVVTNHHVVERADEIEVQLADDRKFNAEIVGSDERTDVALLRLENSKELPRTSWGNSDRLKVGDRVIAIGNPFGLDHTVTSGIVSAKERVIGAGPYDDFIQTDAAINPGNSGGPLFNLKGEVVGINTAINPRGQGIGFAIPANLAMGIIDSLVTKGKVVRGWLGITFQPLDEDLSKAFKIEHEDGVVVTDISPESPAAGVLRTGDIIVSVNKKRVRSVEEFASRTKDVGSGDDLLLRVYWDGGWQYLILKL